MVPAKYRTMILGVVVMIVARQYISGGGDASGNQEYDLDKIVDANIDDAKIDVKIDEVNYAINQTQDPEGNHKILSALSEYIGKAIKAGTLTPETALEKLQHIDVLKGDKAKTFLDMTIQGTDMSDDYDKLMGGSAGNTQTTPDASQKTPNDEKTFHSSDYKDEKSDKVIHATDYNANEQLQKFDDLKDKINDALTKHPDRSKEVYQTLARVVRKLMNSNTVTYDEVLDKLHNIKNLDGDKGKKFMDLAIQ